RREAEEVLDAFALKDARDRLVPTHRASTIGPRARRVKRACTTALLTPRSAAGTVSHRNMAPRPARRPHRRSAGCAQDGRDPRAPWGGIWWYKTHLDWERERCSRRYYRTTAIASQGVYVCCRDCR